MEGSVVFIITSSLTYMLDKGLIVNSFFFFSRSKVPETFFVLFVEKITPPIKGPFTEVCFY